MKKMFFMLMLACAGYLPLQADSVWAANLKTQNLDAVQSFFQDVLVKNREGISITEKYVAGMPKASDMTSKEKGERLAFSLYISHAEHFESIMQLGFVVYLATQIETDDSFGMAAASFVRLTVGKLESIKGELELVPRVCNELAASIQITLREVERSIEFFEKLY